MVLMSSGVLCRSIARLIDRLIAFPRSWQSSMERWHLPEVSGSHHHLVAVAARAGHGGAEADGHGGLAAANHVEHVGAAVAVLLLVELPHVRPARAERPVNLEEEGAYKFKLCILLAM